MEKLTLRLKLVKLADFKEKAKNPLSVQVKRIYDLY